MGLTFVDDDPSPPRDKEIKTRDDLVQAIGATAATVLFAAHAFRVATHPAAADWSHCVSTIADDRHTADVAIGRDWSPILADQKGRSDLILVHDQILVRALAREPYELLIDYTERTGQRPLLCAQPWYRFARVLRNVASHRDCRLREWPYDAQHLKERQRFTAVSWKDRSIDKSMVGKPITFSLLDAIRLVQDELGFAITLR